jgi:hypothetical protein
MGHMARDSCCVTWYLRYILCHSQSCSTQFRSLKIRYIDLVKFTYLSWNDKPSIANKFNVNNPVIDIKLVYTGWLVIPRLIQVQRRRCLVLRLHIYHVQ